LIRRRIESNVGTAAELGSTQADYKEMQSTCQAGTDEHYSIRACWDDEWPHPSVVYHSSTERSIAHLLHGIPRWKQKKVKPSTAKRVNLFT